MANQKRKVFATTASAALVASAVAPTAAFAATSDFPDLPEDHMFASQVHDLVEAGVIEGYEDGSFKPGDKVTRAEVSKMIASIRDMDTNAPNTDFPDVKEDVWYTDPINELFAAGYINGYPDGTFEPAGQMSRAEFAKLVVQAYDLDIERVDTPFTDLKDNVWYSPYIETLYANELIQGQTPTTFGPSDSIKRVDLAGLLANTDYRFGSKLPKPDEVPGFAINSVNATANKDYTVDVSGEVSGAERVTVTIDGVEKTADLKEGKYSFKSEPLEIGTYEVTVKAFIGDDSISKTTQVAVVDEDTSIAGFVTDEYGVGVSGATVQAGDNEVTTDANGFYQFKGLQTDKYYNLKVMKSNYATQTDKVRVADDRVSTAMFDQFESIEQADIEITGTVQDKVTSDDVTPDTVALQAYSEELGKWVTVSEQSPEGNEYTFDQDDVDPGYFLEFGGEYKLVFTKPSGEKYHAAETDVTVTDEAQITEVAPVEMQAIKASTVSGTITGAEGAPAGNVEVTLGGQTATTNANGVYEFKGNNKLVVASGDHPLKAVYQDGAGDKTVSTETVSITEGEPHSGQDLTLAFGTAAKFSLDADAGKTLDGSVTATIINSDGEDVAHSTVTPTNNGKTVEFNFDNNLRADNYTAVVTGDYVQTSEYDFTVTAKDVNAYTQAPEGDKPTLEVIKEKSIAPAGVIEGTDTIVVTNPEDLVAPANDTSTDYTNVVLKDSAGNVVDTQVTDGNIHWGGLAAGKYSLSLVKPGYEFNKTVSVTVKESDSTEVDTGKLELVVPTQEASVQGVVRSADTKAEIDNASVTFYQNGVAKYNYTAAKYKAGVDVKPGLYTVVVRGDESNQFVTYHEELTLKNKQDLENYHFDLESGAAQIDVTVVDGDNKAVNGSTVTVFDAWGPVASETLSDNEVLFENLSTGDFSVLVNNATGYEPQSLGVSLSDNEDFQTKITMQEPATEYPVDVKVLDTNADALSGAKIVVFDKDGNIIDSNAGQNFSLTNGSYSVGAYLDGHYVSSESFEINRSGETVILEVEEGNWK